MCTSEAFASFRGLRDDGWSRADIDRSLDAGRVTRVRRGIYELGTGCAPATTAVKHGGTLHCISAARHEGLWVLSEDTRLHVGMRPGDHQYPQHDGCGCLAHWDDRPTDSFGLPSVPRILRQILRCCGLEDFFVALESAKRQRKIDAQGLAWLNANSNDAARRALRLARSDADSGLESLVRWRLRDRGLEVRTQLRVPRVGWVDLVIGARLIVETDGRDNHDDESHRHKDLVRDAHAASQGYVTLRFDYALVVHDWPLVERAILAQVAAGHHL